VTISFSNNILHHGVSIGVIKSRGMRLAGYVARMREIRNAYDILVGKPEGKRPL
jgi:hypothetical protein